MRKNNLLKALVIILVLIIIIPFPGYTIENIKVTVDGKLLVFDVQPTIVNGRTMVPLRGIFEAFKVEPVWDSATSTVFAVSPTTSIILPIGSTTPLVNGKAVILDVPAITKSGRTMVPARFIAESLGATVVWDGNSNTVIITSNSKSTNSSEERQIINGLIWNDGTYDGEILNGIPNGQGTTRWPNGDKHIGGYLNGSREGMGLYIWPNGEKYIGSFKNGNFHGLGTYLWTNNSGYHGDWVENYRTGFGTFVWTDGSYYSGEFLNDLFHGKGIVYDAAGEILAQGSWINNEFQGTGVTAPSNLWTKAVSSTEVEVSWEVVNSADYYHVYYSLNLNGPFQAFMDETGSRMKYDYSSITVSGLFPGQTSYYKVTTVKDGVESDFSDIVSATSAQINNYYLTPNMSNITSDVVESMIDGAFEGWDGDTIFKLMNGQIWQQSVFAYHYHYAFMPRVIIYRSGSQYKMQVEGLTETIVVERLK